MTQRNEEDWYQELFERLSRIPEEDLQAFMNKKEGIFAGWKTVAIVSMGLLLAMSVGLIVLASTDGRDALTTIALLLAVFSFTAQLVVTGVQARTSDRQHQQMQSVTGKAEQILLGLTAEVRDLKEINSSHVGSLIELVSQALPSVVENAMEDAPVADGAEGGEESSPDRKSGSTAGTHEADENRDAEVERISRKVTHDIVGMLTSSSYAGTLSQQAVGVASSGLVRPGTILDRPDAGKIKELLSMSEEGMRILFELDKDYAQKQGGEIEFNRDDQGNPPRGVAELIERGILRLDPPGAVALDGFEERAMLTMTGRRILRRIAESKLRPETLVRDDYSALWQRMVSASLRK